MAYSLAGYGSRLVVRLTSTNDYMRVRVIVDGMLAFEDSRAYRVDFEKTLGLGYHTVQVIIENPTSFGLGPSILVAGEVALYLW